MIKNDNTLPESVIPKGDYCYVFVEPYDPMKLRTKICPYWKVVYGDTVEHNLYYCRFLEICDCYQGDTLLWDQCKECGINIEEIE